MTDKILILDFGSQYTQLIARRIRELNVYSEIVPFNFKIEFDENIKGIILSGSPCSVFDTNAPNPKVSELINKIPVLGICYGAQLLAHQNNGAVTKSLHREYGRAKLIDIDTSNKLFQNIDELSQVWMSHGDSVSSLSSDFEIVAKTQNIPIAAFKHKTAEVYGIQFHPEVTHSADGKKIIQNFVIDVCKASPNWTPQHYINTKIEELKNSIQNDKVVLGLSGGVDSSVAAMLLHKAIGKNLYCIFVDNGLLRKNEFENVLKSYTHMGLNVKGVQTSNLFYRALKGITDPELKRKAIGKTFIDIFDSEAHSIQDVKWLAQGTIYPDVIESVSVNGPSVTIKSHHNVGGLPDKMKLKIVEPLRLLFKDEVRRVGAELQIDSAILNRHPFPGPGLGIRILGDVTPEKVNILQEVDDIFISSLKEFNLYDEVWQAGSILTPIQSVGVMGDERTYENVVALRAVTSVDGMTADWARLPYDFLAHVSNLIINKVKGVNRVVYDISSKPPATIEWE